MSTTPGIYGGIRHTYGLPAGTVRGFMSVLICSFFWIVLLISDQTPPFTAPLGHFVLLFLVFSAFASHPIQHDQSPLLPWLMRLIFVGGSVAVIAFVAINYPGRLQERLTPSHTELPSWLLLVSTMAIGFAAGLFARFVLGRDSNLYMTIRGWLGTVAMLLLVAETVFQFVIRPAMGNPPTADALKIWEAIIIAFVSAYFGTRS